MSGYSNSSYSIGGNEDDDQDTSAAAPVEEGVDQTQADDAVDNVGEVKHAEDDTEDSLRHNLSDDGAVIGRRNPDLPIETQG